MNKYFWYKVLSIFLVVVSLFCIVLSVGAFIYGSAFYGILFLIYAALFGGYVFVNKKQTETEHMLDEQKEWLEKYLNRDKS